MTGEKKRPIREDRAPRNGPDSRTAFESSDYWQLTLMLLPEPAVITEQGLPARTVPLLTRVL